MRVVLDTNVVISGLLWLGPPHDVLALAAAGAISLCATEAMLTELHAVLSRAKFRATISRRQTTVDELVTSILLSFCCSNLRERLCHKRCETLRI